MILISGPNEPQGAHPSPSACAPAAARGPTRPHLGPCPDAAPGPTSVQHRGTLVLLRPLSPHLPTAPPLTHTQTHVPGLHALPSSTSGREAGRSGSLARAPGASGFRTWAGGVSGAWQGESHLRCPPLGGRGRAGRGRDWRAAEPRPTPIQLSPPPAARAPPPAPAPLLHAVRRPRRPLPPLARTRARSPAPQARLRLAPGPAPLAR